MKTEILLKSPYIAKRIPLRHYVLRRLMFQYNDDFKVISKIIWQEWNMTWEICDFQVNIMKIKTCNIIYFKTWADMKNWHHNLDNNLYQTKR